MFHGKLQKKKIKYHSSTTLCITKNCFISKLLLCSSLFYPLKSKTQNHFKKKLSQKSPKLR